MNRSSKQTAFLVLSLLAMFFFVSVAESAETRTLGEILKKTESQYQQMKAFTAQFKQYTTSAAASSIAATEASGKLYYQKPRQIRWEYEKPEPQVFVANHQLAWMYSPAENQVSMFDAKTFFASPLAQTFFDGFIELRKNFEVSLDPKRSNSTSAVLVLKPRHEDPNVRLLHLWIELSTHRIATIETQDSLGNINRIVLETQNNVPQIDQKKFQLDVPASTPIVDLEGRELSADEVSKLKQKLAE